MSLPSEHDSLDLHALGAADAGAPPEEFLGLVRGRRRDVVRFRALSGAASVAIIAALAVTLQTGDPLDATEPAPILVSGNEPSGHLSGTTLASLRQTWSTEGSLPLAGTRAAGSDRSFRVRDADLLLDGGL